MKLSQDIGIDLGTTTVLIYVRGKGIILKEPSIVAIDKNTGEILAYGSEAKKMDGKTSKNIETIYPLKDGAISDYSITEKMLKRYIGLISDKKIVNPSIVICVPSGVTKLEKKAVIDVAINAGARRVSVIQEPLAAAIGIGIDVTKPKGNLIIDVGGGTTDIAAIALGGIVKSNSIKVAGNSFDMQIQKYIKEKYNLKIGLNTAEKIKINIGSVYKMPTIEKMSAKGIDCKTGLPEEIVITSEEIYELLNNSAKKILEAVKEVLEELPAEMSSDIKENGVYLTGAGSLIQGLDKLIAMNTDLEVNLVNKPDECVAIGTGKATEIIDLLDNGNGMIR